ncbi:MAG: response regulator transcription factor [Kiritimatiellia bacterium]|jgi:two-component system chemotaxis response regulator CheY
MSNEKPRVLVADDEMVMRMFIVSILKKMDCEVVGQAANGSEAASMYREKKPDLLMMDINMPLKTGEEALREIMAEFPEARVIMLTSVIESATVEKCIALGAAGYIRKDSPVDEIKAIINDTLQSGKE